MPELPEVTTIKRVIEPQIKGLTIFIENFCTLSIEQVNFL